MKAIDLRSDTVTMPTPVMMDAIMKAGLGDDVFGEDPTTRRFEELAAETLGMESAMLVASGTMGNLVSLLTHCGRGDEVILGDEAHIFHYEVGGMSALGGIMPHLVPNNADGTMALEYIERAVRGDNIHYPRTRLICLENTHNRCNGAPLTAEYTGAVIDLARSYGLKVHLDGARIFNAAVALNVPARDLARGVDSVSFCLSKGLSAPIGSVVCGSHEFIAEARRHRKAIGGGMRQTGILAAPGMVALREMTERLAEDHENARLLAEGIAGIPGLSVAVDQVRTNIVFFTLENEGLSDDDFLAETARRGLLLLNLGPARFRAVTHYGITKDDIKKALSLLKTIIERK